MPQPVPVAVVVAAGDPLIAGAATLAAAVLVGISGFNHRRVRYFRRRFAALPCRTGVCGPGARVRWCRRSI